MNSATNPDAYEFIFEANFGANFATVFEPEISSERTVTVSRFSCRHPGSHPSCFGQPAAGRHCGSHSGCGAASDFGEQRPHGGNAVSGVWSAPHLDRVSGAFLREAGGVDRVPQVRTYGIPIGVSCQTGARCRPLSEENENG